jgi:inosine/xanthosine triphosphatase
MIVAIGSKNPAKINAVKLAFQEIHKEVTVMPMDVDSGVSEQPFSDDETIKGAKSRAENCFKEHDVEIAIGLEGGVTETEYGLCVCNWGALVQKGKSPIIAGGARIFLPDEISNRLRAGEELGPVMDAYANKKNVRKKEGAVGIFTNGLVTRDEMFVHVMKLLIGQYQYKNMIVSGKK